MGGDVGPAVGYVEGNPVGYSVITHGMYTPYFVRPSPPFPSVIALQPAGCLSSACLNV